MHAEDLAAIGELAIGARDLVNGIRLLIQIPPQCDIADVKRILHETTRDLATLTEYLQQREARAWGRPDHAARHPPNRWITSASELEAARERRRG